MFTCTYYSIDNAGTTENIPTLHFTSPQFSVSVTPSPEEKITPSTEGGIYGIPTHGKFDMFWNNIEFTFYAALYGEGGILIVKIVNTPEIAASFAEAVKVWNSLLP